MSQVFKLTLVITKPLNILSRVFPYYTTIFHSCLLLLPASQLSEVRRNCRFRTENQGLKLFKQYSQNSCMFECHLAMATQNCGCVPWDYPHFERSGLSDICDGWGRYCFESVMKDTNRGFANCKHCLPDCSITRYKL